MKPIIWNKIVLALGISIIAIPALADENSSSTNQSPPAFTSQQFVSDAAVGGMKEVYLSQLALEKTQNADVRRFAGHMIKDHNKANGKLMDIANAEGLSFPATNTFSADDPNWNSSLLTSATPPKGDQLLMVTNLAYFADYQAIQRLKSVYGSVFDQAYAGEMVNDHTNAVQEFSNAEQNLSDKKLQKFAHKTLPILQKHYGMAEDLANELNAGAGTNNVSATNSVTMPMGSSGSYP